MRLILDSHILPGIALNRLDAVNPTIANAIARPEMDLSASTASLWDIAVKARLGKLDPGMPIDILPSFFEAIGIGILPISAQHAVAVVDPIPPTRDRVDRMLLAQCLVEDRRLVTINHALRDHPLAARFDEPKSTIAKSPKTRP